VKGSNSNWEIDKKGIIFLVAYLFFPVNFSDHIAKEATMSFPDDHSPILSTIDATYV
jgi:hypothetical protein